MVDHPLIEIEIGEAELALVRFDPRPFDRKAIAVEADRLCNGHILPPAMQAVVGIARWFGEDGRRHMFQQPDVGHGRVSFDLIAGGSGTPQKTVVADPSGGHRHGERGSGTSRQPERLASIDRRHVNMSPVWARRQFRLIESNIGADRPCRVATPVCSRSWRYGFGAGQDTSGVRSVCSRQPENGLPLAGIMRGLGELRFESVSHDRRAVALRWDRAKKATIPAPPKCRFSRGDYTKVTYLHAKGEWMANIAMPRNCGIDPSSAVRPSILRTRNPALLRSV